MSVEHLQKGAAELAGVLARGCDGAGEPFDTMAGAGFSVARGGTEWVVLVMHRSAAGLGIYVPRPGDS